MKHYHCTKKMTRSTVHENNYLLILLVGGRDRYGGTARRQRDRQYGVLITTRAGLATRSAFKVLKALNLIITFLNLCVFDPITTAANDKIFLLHREFLQWLRIILNVKERGASRKAAGREVRQASGKTTASEKPRVKGGGCCNRRCRRAAATPHRARCILAYYTHTRKPSDLHYW